MSENKQPTDRYTLNVLDYISPQSSEATENEVVQIIPDDISDGGYFMNREGKAAFLHYIEELLNTQSIVTLDDLKRYACVNAKYMKGENQ